MSNLMSNGKRSLTVIYLHCLPCARKFVVSRMEFD